MAVKDLLLEECGKLDITEKKQISKSYSKRPQTLIHGEAEIRDQFGNLLQKKNNIILLGGRRFILEKIFDIELSADRKVTLNELFGVNTTETTDDEDGPLRHKKVCLFGVGRGGSSLTFGDVEVPAEKEFNLYDMIPFRYVPITHDLDPETKSKYYLRVLVDANGAVTQSEADAKYIAYYLKTFEQTPELIIKIGEDTYFPNKEEDNLPTNWDDLIERKDVDMYIQLRLRITADDCREYFIETESINNARINELGTFFGYQPDSTQYSDYNGIEDFSKLCFNNEPLDDETKELNIIYKFFI